MYENEMEADEAAVESGGFDIRAMLAKYLESYRYFIVFLAIFGVLVITAANLVTPKYTAIASISPASNNSMSGLASLGSILGGSGGSLSGALSSFLNQSSSNSFDQYSEILQSGTLADTIIKKYPKMMPELFPDWWNNDTNNWYSRKSPIPVVKDFVKRLVLMEPHNVPNRDDLDKLFSQNMTIQSGLMSSLTTVSWTYRTSDGAEKQLRVLLREADNILRDQQRRDVLKQIAYLNKIVDQTSATDVRTALISLIGQDQQMLAVLNSNNYYAVTVVDGPTSALIPTFPSLVQILAAIVVLSLASWSGIVFLVQPGSPRRERLDRIVWHLTLGGPLGYLGGKFGKKKRAYQANAEYGVEPN